MENLKTIDSWIPEFDGGDSIEWYLRTYRMEIPDIDLLLHDAFAIAGNGAPNDGQKYLMMVFIRTLMHNFGNDAVDLDRALSVSGNSDQSCDQDNDINKSGFGTFRDAIDNAGCWRP